MKRPSKQDWLVAEVLVDVNDSFVLWMVHSGFCSNYNMFRSQYGRLFPLNDV